MDTRTCHFLSCAMICISINALSAAEFPSFEAREIDPHAGEIVYAVTLADVDGDKKQDIVAVTERAVLWYQNPSWKKHVIIEDQVERDCVCIAPLDIDEDGKVDFALGAGWTKVGTIQWLSRGDSLEEKWNVHMIDKELWTHRMRWADVLGTGRPQLVVSPLNKSVGDGVRLTAFEIPENPKADRWPRTLLDGTLNRMHNHWHIDLNRDGSKETTLTASAEGLHAIFKRQGEFVRLKLPNSEAAGEVKTGRLGNNRGFVTAIEPMHGSKVAVYLREGRADQNWPRVVIEESLGRGHALWAADVDDDGVDEIIVGHSEPATGDIKGPGIYIYDSDDTGRKWTKHVIDDGGIATEDAIAADLNGDGRIDIVAGGRDTHNVKLYLNRGVVEGEE